MKAVVATGFVMEDERRGLLLTCAVAAIEKLLVVGRKWFFIGAKFRRPVIRYFREMWIRRGAERFDDLRQRITKIFVVALAEAVALHDHVTAKDILLRKKRDESGALLQIQEWTRRRIAGLG